MNDDPRDNYAALLSALDQAKASMPILAGALSSYFHALLSAGFERPEALELTRDWGKSVGLGA